MVRRSFLTVSSNLSWSDMIQEPHLSFCHAALKIVWAGKLINHLDGWCKEFIESKPYDVTSERDDPSGSNYLVQAGATKPIPPAISLLTGDIVGNLRSSLDFAWMGLARDVDPKLSRLTLPTASNRQGLVKTIQASPVGQAFPQTEGLLGDTIRSHRDFTNGGNRAVAALNQLANWNKHNLLIIGVAHTSFSFSIGTNVFTDMQVEGDIRRFMEFENLGDDEPTHQREATFEIIFNEEHTLVARQALIPTLIRLSQASMQAVQAFCDAFPSLDNPRFA